MAVKKSAGQDGSAAKPKTKAKAGGKKSAAKEETAPKKTTKAASSSAPKKAAPKKAAAPIKLSSSQEDLLKKIGEAAAPGYRSEKKAEQRTLDALQERKLIKRGAKDKASGTHHYLISNAGKKHLESQANASAPSSSTPPPANP